MSADETATKIGEAFAEEKIRIARAEKTRLAPALPWWGEPRDLFQRIRDTFPTEPTFAALEEWRRLATVANAAARRRWDAA